VSAEGGKPVWLQVELVIAIHERQLREFGGRSGIRDRPALESALGRARNKWAYENAELPELAAAYAFGIARNHPFVDGNERVALLAFVAFLGLNGVNFMADEAEAASIILALAAGEVDEEGLGRWINDNLPKG
jgi:death-on-curing protein